MMKTITRVMLLCVGVLLLSACPGDTGNQSLQPNGGDQSRWQSYTSSEYQFTIRFPLDWKVVEPATSDYSTNSNQFWFVSEALPRPQTDSRADIVLIFTQEDPSTGWEAQYFNDYRLETFWLGEIQANRISGINKESNNSEIVVLARIGEYYLEALPNHSTASLEYFDPVISSIRFVQAEATSPPPSVTSIQGNLDDETIVFEGFGFTYPSSLVEGAVAQTIPALSDPTGFMYDDLPEHVRVYFFSPYTARGQFNGLQSSGIPWLRHQDLEGPEIQPIIFIFPTSDYAEISPLASERIEALKVLLDGNSLIAGGELPVLPTFNSAQDMNGQVKSLEFQGGRGLRFIARYSQGVVPVVNPGIFYSFQGLTNDGAVYVAAFFPLYVSALPNQVQVEDLDAFYQGYSEYMTNITSSIEKLEPGDFEPDLDTLDALVRSMTIDASSFTR